MKLAALLTLFTLSALRGDLIADSIQNNENQVNIESTSVFVNLPVGIEANIGSGQGIWQDR